MRKTTRILLAATLGVAGATFVASPAFALGACSPTTNPTIAVCINHGDSGLNTTRGDFYLYRHDDSIYTYKEVFVVNGVERSVPVKSDRLDASSSAGHRYCCNYTNLGTAPATRKTVKNRVYVYRRDGVRHMTVDSPEITFSN
jgi:hypothetical protein